HPQAHARPAALSAARSAALHRAQHRGGAADQPDGALHRAQHQYGFARSRGGARLSARDRGQARPALRRSGAQRGQSHHQSSARLTGGMAPSPQRLSVTRRAWPLARPFAISRGSKTTAEVVVAEIFDGDVRGRGECVPYPRYGEGVVERVRAVRRAAPAARLIVDANEGWSERHLTEVMPALAELGVELIEQPLPAAHDEALARVPHPIPVCADEACHTAADLDRLIGKYDAINIKLDKAGGLTEALELATAARARGFTIMVGCMIGTSLAMAPAVLVAQQAAVVDLDAPLLLATDRTPGLRYDGSTLYPPEPALWG